MRKLLLTLVAIFIITFFAGAQGNFYNKTDLGVGMGINYGGFGFNLAVAPIPYFSVEGFFGYNLHKANVGGAINIHVTPKNNVKVHNLVLKTIYGYNAVLITHDGNMDSKTFYGLSFGLSNKFRFGQMKKKGFDVDLIIPIRGKEVDDYYNELEDNGYEMSQLFPVAITIGYHIEF